MFKITKFNLCVIGMFVGIGLNIQRQVSLEMNQPGLNYLVLAVQFADGTSGVYSGVMDVDAFSSKSQGENYLDYQLDETDSETGKSFKQWQLETPPFNNPLDKQSDKAEWWRIHSPLYLQTAALGARDTYGRLEIRKSDMVNKDLLFQGIRVITVNNNIISRIDMVNMETMRQQIGGR